MTGDSHDADLYTRFAALKHDDERAAPAFATPHGRPRRRRAGPWAAVVALAAGAAWCWGGTAVRRDRWELSELTIDLRSTTWVAPTDFLLRTPGIDLLRVVPAIGTPAPPRTPSRPLEPTPSERRQQS